MTLSACETALGRDAGGEGFVGFTQALLDVGDAERLPVALEGRRHGDGALDAAVLRQPAGPPTRAHRPDAEGRGASRSEVWLRGLRRAEVLALTAELSGGVERGKGAKARRPAELAAAIPAGGTTTVPTPRRTSGPVLSLAGRPGFNASVAS